MSVVIWKGTTALVEQPSSPQWQFGERVTCRRIYRGPYALCLSSAPLRGWLGTGEAFGLRVAQSSVQKVERGGIGELVIDYETNGQPEQGGTLPPDEFTVKSADQEVALRKHPNYVDAISDEVYHEIRVALETTDPTKYEDAIVAIAVNPPADELYAKLQRDFTHYKGQSAILSVKSFYWDVPAGLTAGGFRQTPPFASIFFPAGLEWLRDADDYTWNGTHWEVDRKWLGAEELDHDIYP